MWEEIADGPIDAAHGGRAGSGGLLDEMGAAFGADFSSVRIHHGDGRAEAMGAEAMAHGDDIHVAAHRDPGDKELIGHELAHVVQQREGRVAAPQGKDGEVVDPALEEEADRAGGAVASGQPVPAEARARTGAARGGDGPIQLHRDPLKGIDLYLKVHEVQVWATLKDHLAAVPWPAPHPNVAWMSSTLFGLGVWAALRDGAMFLDEPNEIAKLVFPANHRDVLGTILPSYTQIWLPGVGRAFAELVEDATRASLRRLGPRYAAVAEHDATSRGTVEYSQLVKSHPIDGTVARALLREGVARYAPRGGKPDPVTKPRPVRSVKLEWQGPKDPSLWNWVKADPPDATVEDVAASLYSKYGDTHPGESGSTLAYGLTQAPPLFGLPPSWARSFADARKYAPAGATAETDRGARMVALAASKVDDEIAVAQRHADATKAPTPKAAELSITLGDSLIATSYLHRSLSAWNQAPAIDTTIRWIKEKQAQVATMPSTDLGTWGPIIEGQKDRLRRIVGGVKSVVENTSGLGLKDATSPNARPIAGILATYAQAAALSHLTDTGEHLIAEAAQQQQQLAIAMLRRVANDMNNVVEVAAQASQRGIAPLSSEAGQVTADARRLQQQLAAGVAVDSAAIEETTLHAQEIAFKTRVQGLFGSVRSLRVAVDKAGAGLASHIARHFHGSFKALEQALEPVEDTIHTIVANQQNEDATIAGGTFETPADNRALRGRYLKNNQKLLDQLASHTDLVAFLREGADTVQWQQFATGCVQMLALIGLSIVAGAAGGAVARGAGGALGRVGSAAAVADMAGSGGMLARASSLAAGGAARLGGAATEAGIITAGQINLQGGDANDAFFANLLSTIGANAILGTLTRDLAVARSLEVRTAGHWAKRAGKLVLKETVAISAHTIMNVAIGYLAHMVVTRKQVTAMMARDWLMQGISTGLGRYVGGSIKARKPTHEKLGRLPEALGGKRLLVAGEELAALAKAAETAPSADAATELLAKRSQVLEQELQILETIERNPELLAAHPGVKLGVRDVKAAIASIRGEQARLAPQSRRLLLEAAGLEEIVPGSEYRGSADQLRRVIESAHEIGLAVGTPKKSGTTTRVTIGDAEIVFHEGAPTPAAPARRTPEEQFLEAVRAKLDPIERAKLDEIVGKRPAKQVHDSFGGDVERARKSVAVAVARQKADAAAAVASQVKAERIRQWVEDAGLMKDARARQILETLERRVAEATVARDEARKAGDAAGVDKQNEKIETAHENAHEDIRSHVMTSYMQAQLAMKHPRSRVRKDVQVWQEQPGDYASSEDYKATHREVFKKSRRGVKFDPVEKRIFLEITDIDLMVTMDQPSGKAKILNNEEIKTGRGDSPTKARAQLDDGHKAIAEAATGGRKVILLEAGKDITGEIDLTSMSSATSHTRGPANKGFETSLEISATDLDAVIRKLMEPPKPGSPS